MIEPIYDRLLVRTIEGGDKTRGGLFVPQVAQDNSPWWRGEVVAAGSGRIASDGHVVPLTVKAGDIVVFIRIQGIGEQIVFTDEHGEDLLVIREPHVLGKITPNSAEASAPTAQP